MVNFGDGSQAEGIVEKLIPYIQVCCMDENGTFIRKFSNEDAAKCLTVLPRKTPLMPVETKGVSLSKGKFEFSMTRNDI